MKHSKNDLLKYSFLHRFFSLTLAKIKALGELFIYSFSIYNFLKPLVHFNTPILLMYFKESFKTIIFLPNKALVIYLLKRFLLYCFIIDNRKSLVGILKRWKLTH